MKTLLLIPALLVLPVLAEAQTHTFNIKVTMLNVAADGSNKPTQVKIERKLGTAGTFAQIANVSAVLPDTVYQDAISNPAPGGVQYCYRVRASNVIGDSLYSVEGCGTTAVVIVPKAPEVPTGFSVSAISNSIIELSWGTVDTAEGYKWERRKGNQPKIIENSGTVLATATSFRDVNLQRRRTYCYDIWAYNLGGASQPSQVLCATTRP